jgi:SAM-dependent methyltransferase
VAASDDLWETHAGWWQAGFTEGADAEYEEQILPLAAQHLAGAARVLDVGTGEGQVARLAARLGTALVAGVDPTWAQLVAARDRAGGPVYGRAEAAALPFAGEAFDAVVACLVFEHIEAPDAALAEVAPAGASSSSSTTRCSRRRAAAGSTTTSWRSSTGASGPTWWRTRRWRRWRRTSSSRSSTDRCPAT